MAIAQRRVARINVPVSRELMNVIERAAAQMGQSVSDFAVSTLVRTSRSVLAESAVLRLSDRDRDRFVAALDNLDVKPNKALRDAAKHYRKRVVQR